MTIPILYQDESLLLCAKPAGVVSEPDRGRGMPELLAAQLREAGEPDNIAGVHRLDRQVGGLMVFSRRKDVTGALIEKIRRREMEKEYLAVLRGRPDAPEGTLEDLLFHDSRSTTKVLLHRLSWNSRSSSTPSGSAGIPRSTARYSFSISRRAIWPVSFPVRSFRREKTISPPTAASSRWTV